MSSREPATSARSVTLNLRQAGNEQNRPMLWMASWLVGRAGEEGDWFFSGTEASGLSFDAPTQALGVRIRRWPSEGLDPEYVDIELGWTVADIGSEGLDFDRPQPNSRLRTTASDFDYRHDL